MTYVLRTGMRRYLDELRRGNGGMTDAERAEMEARQLQSVYEIDMRIAGKPRIAFEAWKAGRRVARVRFQRMPLEWQAEFRALVQLITEAGPRVGVSPDPEIEEVSRKLAAMHVEMERRTDA